YALGAMLYELLTGRPPFKGETPIETLRQAVEDDVVPPSRLVPRVARDLETICLHCLEKDPARRYASARGLALDLENQLAGRPIAARRTPAWERSLKLARRHPVAATLFVLGLLTAVGLGGAWMRSSRIRQERAIRAARDLAERRREVQDSLWDQQEVLNG